MSHDLETRTREFFAAWDTDFAGFTASLRDAFADDAVWEQGPIPTTRSREEAVELMTKFRDAVGLGRIKVDVNGLWVSGDTVATERVDHLYTDDGTLLGSFPVAGLIRFDDEGRIAHWREYFDASGLGPMLAAIGAPAAAQA